jgi:hypothetical protein
MSRVLRLVDRQTGEVTFEGKEVTNSVPCPICAALHKKQSWCMIDTHRGLVICPRVESRKKIGSAGWLHNLDGRDIGEAARYSVQVWKSKSTDTTDFTALQHKYAGNATIRELSELGGMLKVSKQSLESFGVGWDGRCWSFPMWSRGVVCGIRLRAPDRKFCVTGSRLGLFLPRHGAVPNEGDLFICEGESDAISMTDIGFCAVGRPGCKLAISECCEVSSRRDVIVARDNDEAGKNGAKELVRSLMGHARSVAMIAPPSGYKDFRAWINDGAEADDIKAIVKARRGW